MRRPIVAPHFTVRRVDPDVVILLSETQELVLRSAFLYELVPYLDGRTVEQIAASLEDTTVEDIEDAVATLHDRGLVQELVEERAREASLWSALGHDAPTAFARLDAARVRLTAREPGDAEAFTAALRDWGLGVGDDGALDLVVVHDVLAPELEQVNLRSLEERKPWLLVRPSGRRPWLGPLFVPGKTACWECLAQRQRFNRQIEISLNAGSTANLVTAARSSRGSVGLVAHHAAVVAARWFASGGSELEGYVRTFDLASGEVETHELVRRPQCRACGTPRTDDLERYARIDLESKHLADSSGRTLSPAETLRRYGKHVSRLTGVVTRVEQAEGTDGTPIHVFNSGYNLVRPVSAAGFIVNEFRSQSQGKGRTSIEARVGALAEAIERYCTFASTDEDPAVHATLRELGERAVDPRSLMLFSEDQYRDRDAWNKRHKRAHRVPLPFDPDVVLEWTPIWSMTHRCVRFLPARKRNDYVVSDTNGNAAGTSLEDAILQGFYELVERDAISLWWYNRVARPGVDLDSFDDPYLRELREYYRVRLNRSLWVIDITSDFGIPSFAAGSADLATNGKITLGFGSHRDAAIALKRALTEGNQFLSMIPSLDASTPEDIADRTRPEIGWYHGATLATDAYVFPDGTRPERRASDYPHDWSLDAKDNVERCQALVEARGMELLVLNLTRPDIEMPVVKVVAPGMRYHWPRYGAGRLYTTPIELGWKASETPESELNPMPIFW
jgi:oxazoline/thiazoline synthase